jgi:hypothetical protein
MLFLFGFVPGNQAEETGIIEYLYDGDNRKTVENDPGPVSLQHGGEDKRFQQAVLQSAALSRAVVSQQFLV